jgi:hypothetical protein
VEMHNEEKDRPVQKAKVRAFADTWPLLLLHCCSQLWHPVYFAHPPPSRHNLGDWEQTLDSRHAFTHTRVERCVL